VTPNEHAQLGEGGETTDLVGAETADLVPAVPPGESVLWLRDSLRDLFGVLSIHSRVQLSPFGLSRRMAIDPLSLDEARTLARALKASSEAPERLRKGAAVWCDEAGMVGEVQVPGVKRVRLRSVAKATEWWSEPLNLRPATLAEIDAARDAATRLADPGSGRWR
jgi:hypothetical protein